ncbi:E3 Ubiquitin ligase [Halogranum gelatinilyticum]|uniref:RING-type E3 ubiquitin transferase n=1 Tax=Halogranum gelatinilyticum TaxID=660521 RepID=A0A1G9PYF3_9EURY|nr:GIDE domain-containing protein [Halogranum gelatinilyticum]SDM03521.1 E3 Ubiquitin ligase [Halogranum gelatinilyticum]
MQFAPPTLVIPTLPPTQLVPFLGVGTFVALAFVLIGGYIATRGLGSVRVALRLLRTPTVPVRELMEGTDRQMTLSGTARPTGEDEPLAGPFSGRPAFVVGYEVKEERSSYNASTKTSQRTWETVDSGWAGVPFVLEDETGRVRVDPATATFEVSLDESTRVAGGRSPPDRIRTFIEVNERVDDESHGFDVGPLRFPTGRDRKYVEYRIEAGDAVSVLGTPRRARGDVGEVNAVVDGGDPFVVVDGSPRSATWRLALGSLVPLLVGGVFAAIGLVWLVGGFLPFLLP